MCHVVLIAVKEKRVLSLSLEIIWPTPQAASGIDAGPFVSARDKAKHKKKERKKKAVHARR